MKQKKNKTHYVILGLYAMTALCLTASISGTFAWYTYSTRTGLTFEGASVADAGSLQVGIISQKRIDDYKDFGFEEDVHVSGKYIYWSYNGLNGRRINHIIGQNGSATNKLSTVTSGKYHGDGEKFVMYSTPMRGSNYINDLLTNSTVDYAEKTKYVTLPLAFRYADEGTVSGYEYGKRIFLSSVNINSREKISDSIRLFTYSSTIGQYNLINPSEKNDGYDNVGGVLNLDNDGYYDMWTDPNTGKTYEFPYGEFVDDHYEYSQTPNTGLIEVEHENITTFDANHKGGVYPIDWTKTQPETAEYRGMSYFENHRHYLTSTTDVINYGFLTMTIYLEGWDLSVVNTELGHEFSMDLSFEMD